MKFVGEEAFAAPETCTGLGTLDLTRFTPLIILWLGHFSVTFRQMRSQGNFSVSFLQNCQLPSKWESSWNTDTSGFLYNHDSFGGYLGILSS